MKKKARLLVVEDDPNLGLILNEYLQAKGFSSDLATDGEQGLQYFLKGEYDLCVLDVMMPKKDGFTMAKEIKAINTSMPILFLTAKTLKEDTIEGFKIGADDYVTKPFNMEELVLRINAILKRVSGSNQNQDKPSTRKELKFGSFVFYPNDQVLEFNGEKERLSPKENNLLHLFLKQKGNMVDRATALKVVWDDDNYFNSRSMDVYINKLRKKLKKDPAVELLTVHGEGFRLNY